MANGILLKFDVSHHAVVVLLVLKNLALVPLLNSQWRPSELKFLHQSGCPRITTLGQLPWSEMVLHRDCAVQTSEAAKL